MGQREDNSHENHASLSCISSLGKSVPNKADKVNESLFTWLDTNPALCDLSHRTV